MKMQRITDEAEKQQIYVIGFDQNGDKVNRSITDQQFKSLKLSLASLNNTEKHLVNYGLSPIGVCPFNKDINEARKLILDAYILLDRINTQLHYARVDMERDEENDNTTA